MKQWFVCPQLNAGAEMRLFLFPYAGGGPAAFGKWPAAFPGTIETWIAHYPGRGSRHNETPIRQLDALTEKPSQAIQPLLDKPYAFFGHSLGGLVAFELTRLLRKQNLPQPQVLFVSACSAPQLPDPHRSIHKLPDGEFLKSLERLNGIPNEVLNIPELTELLLPSLRADFEVAETYHFTPGESLNCPIVAFGGLDDKRVNREHLEDWSMHTNASFISQYFPGDHFFINTARKSVITSISAKLTTSHAKD